MRGNVEKRKRRLREDAVKFLKGMHIFVTLQATKEMFVYEDGVYVSQGLPERIIFEHVRKVLGNLYTKHDANEVVNTIQTETFVAQDYFEQTPLELLCVRNGILTLKLKNCDVKCIEYLQEIGNPNIKPLYAELSKHDSKKPFTNKLPVFYDPDAKCILVDRFLHQILDSEDDIKAVYEFVGYCLYRGMPIHQSFMFVGEGSNGKSTLLNLIGTFLGKENCASIQLQRLAERFQCAELRYKLLNFFSDLPDEALKHTGIFKMLVSGDMIDAELKNVQKHFRLKLCQVRI
jgi:phage/plasmid-associated DNA primase